MAPGWRHGQRAWSITAPSLPQGVTRTWSLRCQVGVSGRRPRTLPSAVPVAGPVKSFGCCTRGGDASSGVDVHLVARYCLINSDVVE
jgi:hypothetical protein